MSASNYGLLGSATYDPREFVLKALKKVQLNNKNILKFLDSKEIENIGSRITNSIHLLEELDLMLNRETENSAVERVSIHYQWMIDIYEEMYELLNEDVLNRKRIDEIIEMTEATIENLYTGFAEMKE